MPWLRRLLLGLAVACCGLAPTCVRADGGAAPAAVPSSPSVSDALDLQRAHALFSMLRHQDDLKFDLPFDGCYARCHLMTLKLTQMEAPVKRVWAFAAGARLHAKTPKSGIIEWDWHVAPLVAVCQGTQVEWLVFDPTLYDRPVTIEKWAAGMRKAPSSPWPQITTTLLGEAPVRSGKRIAGTGYWNGADPREGATVHALATLKGFKTPAERTAALKMADKPTGRPHAAAAAAHAHPSTPPPSTRPTNSDAASRD